MSDDQKEVSKALTRNGYSTVLDRKGLSRPRVAGGRVAASLEVQTSSSPPIC